MNKKVRTTLLIELIAEFQDNIDGSNDEETVKYLVKQNLEDLGYNVKKCNTLDTNHALKLEQIKRVDEAELNYQIEVAKLNALIKMR